MCDLTVSERAEARREERMSDVPFMIPAVINPMMSTTAASSIKLKASLFFFIMNKLLIEQFYIDQIIFFITIAFQFLFIAADIAQSIFFVFAIIDNALQHIVLTRIECW